MIFDIINKGYPILDVYQLYYLREHAYKYY